METVVQVENLKKSYDSIEALKGVSFETQKAEIFGLIGPDGAGKTSLFRIMTSLLLPDNGKVRMFGLDPVKEYREIRKIIGYMPGKFSLYQDLSVEENLNFFATVFGTTIEENYDLVEDIYSQIEPFKTRLAGKLSGGMKQKLALSCALIHKPEILILDEPTTGVDAVSRKEFWEMLKKLKQKGITILVSTPYMDEASLCDRVALIQKGKFLQIDTPQAIVNQFPHELYSIKARDKYKLVKDLKKYPQSNSVFPFGQYFHYTGKQEPVNVQYLHKYLENKQHESIEIEKTEPGIEDCFMDLMMTKA